MGGILVDFTPTHASGTTFLLLECSRSLLAHAVSCAPPGFPAHCLCRCKCGDQAPLDHVLVGSASGVLYGTRVLHLPHHHHPASAQQHDAYSSSPLCALNNGVDAQDDWIVADPQQSCSLCWQEQQHMAPAPQQNACHQPPEAPEAGGRPAVPL